MLWTTGKKALDRETLRAASHASLNLLRANKTIPFLKNVFSMSIFERERDRERERETEREHEQGRGRERKRHRI